MPWTCSVDQVGLKLAAILLPQCWKCWVFRKRSPLLTSFKFLHICNSCSISLLRLSSLPLLCYFSLCVVHISRVCTHHTCLCVLMCARVRSQFAPLLLMNFERELLTRPWGSVISLDWLTREVLRSTHPRLLRAWFSRVPFTSHCAFSMGATYWI